MSRGPWVQTLTGRHWYPFSPRAEDVHIEDLRALARVNRFGGHMRKGIDCYTVAEHSVRVAWRAEELASVDNLAPGQIRQIVRAAAAHDAHEAYPPGDQLGPFWRAMGDGHACVLLGLTPEAFSGLRRVASAAQVAVHLALGTAVKTDEGVHGDVVQFRSYIERADRELLATERRDVMAESSVDWGELPAPLPDRILPWTPTRAWGVLRGILTAREPSEERF